MQKNDVYELCKQIAPKYGLDPIFILAICEQESGYNETEARLENGYYRKYVRPDNLPTTCEILLAASYGLMQTMGDVLAQIGYISYDNWPGIAPGIDKYMVTPADQVDCGCQWMKKKVGNDPIFDVFWKYNGSPDYKPLVMARYNKLKQEFGG